MARTKQTAARSTGGRAPRKQLAIASGKKAKALPNNAKVTPKKSKAAPKLSKRAWCIWRIKDRNESGDFQVQWRYQNGRFQTTWTGASTIMEVLPEVSQIVDQWVEYKKKLKGGNPLSLYDFERREKGTGVALLTEDVIGNCALNALESACARLKIDVPHFDDKVRAFVREGEDKLKKDLSDGLSWKQIRAFCFKHLKKTKLDLNTLSKNFCNGTSHHGIKGLKNLVSDNGLYLVGALNTFHVGHCFVLEHKGGTIICYESGEELRLNQDNYNWIENIVFVRKLMTRD
jgi:hypothetical protein